MSKPKEDAVEYVKADRWQPIETAEVGTSGVYVWNGEEVQIGFYVHADGKDWIDLTDGTEIIPKPTHWQPLPEPPRQADASMELTGYGVARAPGWTKEDE